MSIAALRWALRQQAGDPLSKSVLVVLADHANEQAYAYPGQARISAHTEISIRGVRRAMVKLERRGLISRDERRRKDGKRTSDGYRLSMSADDLAPTDPAALVRPKKSAVQADKKAQQPAQLSGCDLKGIPVDSGTSLRLGAEEP